VTTRRRENFINVFPRTGIKEKTIHPRITECIVRHCERRGFPVYTTPTCSSSEYPFKSLFSNYHRWHAGQFSREWLLDIASARLNICCDGGPLNASLAAGVRTVALLSIADESLLNFYPRWQWRSISSTVPCSPCFRAADYNAGRVYGCVRPADVCGDHYDVGAICNAVDELLAQETD
jgi:hypothetical protein